MHIKNLLVNESTISNFEPKESFFTSVKVEHKHSEPVNSTNTVSFRMKWRSTERRQARLHSTTNFASPSSKLSSQLVSQFTCPWISCIIINWFLCWCVAIKNIESTTLFVCPRGRFEPCTNSTEQKNKNKKHAVALICDETHRHT